MNGNYSMIFATSKKYLIVTASYTEILLGTFSPPYFQLPIDVDSITLGKTVRMSLQQTKNNLPTDYNKSSEHNMNLLLGLGIKNIGVLYASKTKNCDVKLWNNNLEIIPMQNTGRQGYIGIKNADEIIGADVTDEELGNAILRGFKKCFFEYWTDEE
jgi:hypothetical protein